MKHIYATLFLVLVSSLALAQNFSVDEAMVAYKVHFDAKEYEKAIPYLEKLDEMNALDKATLNDLIRCYYMLDEDEKTINTASRWLKEYEDHDSLINNILAYGVLADIYYFAGNFKDAKLYYTKLVNIKREKPYQNIWNIFMLGLCEYEEGYYEDMKRYCLDAITDNCSQFGVTIGDIWDDKVQNEDIALMLYHFALALYEVKGNKTEGDAAMQLSAKCGYEEAIKFVDTYKTPCRPKKTKLFSRY